MKQIYLILILFLLPGCLFTNIQIVNVPDSLNNLRSSIISNDNDSRKVIEVKTLYRLKNGMVIDKYRKNYGYWYRVRRGDSLFRIAKRCGITIRKLARVNRVTSKTRLKYKAYLFIPVSESYLRHKADVIIISLKKGDFIWPLYGRITSGFGLRHWGWRKKFHKGIDIAAPVGTKIVSSRKGKVIFAGRKRKYGYIVIIEHNNNFQTRYAHLKKVLVNKDETIKQGQVIGLVGKTGCSTGYHLHFEIRFKNTPINPADYLPEKVNELAKLYFSETSGIKPK